MRSTPKKDESLRQRLAEAVERFSEGSADDFGRKIGYANGGYVREALSGKKPVREALIERVHGTAPMRGWFDAVLASGTKSHHLQVSGATPGEFGSGELTGDDNDVVIPQFATGGAMGGGLVLRDQPGVIHSWHVSEDWIKRNVKHYSSVRNLCIVTGFGDSMRPLFNPGDPLLVDRGVTTVEYDAIYFFRVDGEGFIKRLQRIPGEGLVAISENKAYRDWTITESMSFEVFGRVLKIWRGEDY